MCVFLSRIQVASVYNYHSALTSRLLFSQLWHMETGFTVLVSFCRLHCQRFCSRHRQRNACFAVMIPPSCILTSRSPFPENVSGFGSRKQGSSWKRSWISRKQNGAVFGPSVAVSWHGLVGSCTLSWGTPNPQKGGGGRPRGTVGITWLYDALPESAYRACLLTESVAYFWVHCFAFPRNVGLLNLYSSDWKSKETRFLLWINF